MDKKITPSIMSYRSKQPKGLPNKSLPKPEITRTITPRPLVFPKTPSEPTIAPPRPLVPPKPKKH
jgi:hypothetical protein